MSVSTLRVHAFSTQKVVEILPEPSVSNNDFVANQRDDPEIRAILQKWSDNKKKSKNSKEKTWKLLSLL